jgi:hypothetical protein
MKSARVTPALTVFVQFICLSVALGLPAHGQGDGRFYDVKRQATDYLDSGQYDRAAARFEEVWEKDQSDPSVAEGLAIAYLNGEDRRYHTELEAKAQRLVQEAIRLGGTATFLVQHSHEKFNALKPPNDYCSGKLSIKAGRLVFVAQARKGVEAHSFDATGEGLRVAALGENGAFQIKTDMGNFIMFPRTRIKKDTDLIVSLAQQNLVRK